MPVGWEGQKENDSIDALKHCYKSGINHIRLTYMAMEDQKNYWVALGGTIPRNQVFLATKVGWDMGDYGHYYHPIHMRKQMEKSLTNLQTDCVDLMYLHHCNFGKNNEYFDDALDVIKRFPRRGEN